METFTCMSLTPEWRASNADFVLICICRDSRNLSLFIVTLPGIVGSTCSITCLSTHYHSLCFMLYSKRGPINIHWCIYVFKVKYIEGKLHISFTFPSSVTNAVNDYHYTQILQHNLFHRDALLRLLVVVPPLCGNWQLLSCLKCL